MRIQEAVREFMVAMEQAIPDSPTIPSLQVQKLRVELINEELNELIELVESPSFIGDPTQFLTEWADHIADLLYVVIGAGIAAGLDMGAIFEEVHASNMTKVGGPVSPTGKRLKPETYRPPNIRRHILEQMK